VWIASSPKSQGVPNTEFSMKITKRGQATETVRLTAHKCRPARRPEWFTKSSSDSGIPGGIASRGGPGLPFWRSIRPRRSSPKRAVTCALPSITNSRAPRSTAGSFTEKILIRIRILQRAGEQARFYPMKDRSLSRTASGNCRLPATGLPFMERTWWTDGRALSRTRRFFAIWRESECRY